MFRTWLLVGALVARWELAGAGAGAHEEGYETSHFAACGRNAELLLNLPQGPGLEWIRNEGITRECPGVMFSSSTRADDQLKAEQLGANQFVVKPSSGLKFGEVVEGLRGKWHIRVQNGAHLYICSFLIAG